MFIWKLVKDFLKVHTFEMAASSAKKNEVMMESATSPDSGAEDNVMLLP